MNYIKWTSTSFIHIHSMVRLFLANWHALHIKTLLLLFWIFRKEKLLKHCMGAWPRRRCHISTLFSSTAPVCNTLCYIFFVSRVYTPLFSLPPSILYPVLRSWKMQLDGLKVTQQLRFLVRALTGIRLNEKRGTRNEEHEEQMKKERSGETWIVPFPAAWAYEPSTIHTLPWVLAL